METEIKSNMGNLGSDEWRGCGKMETGGDAGDVVCLYGGFLKWWVSPTNPWVFLLKMIILGWRLGIQPFKETPNMLMIVMKTGQIGV